MQKKFEISPVDSSELSFKTKVALIDLIRSREGD